MSSEQKKEKSKVGKSKKADLNNQANGSKADFGKLVKFAKSKKADALHIYNSYADGKQGAELFLEVNGQLIQSEYEVKSLANLSGELLGFVKGAVNLYKSNLHEAQSAVLSKNESGLNEDLNVVLMQQAEVEREHLIVFLSKEVESSSLADLGLWGEGYVDLQKMALANMPGVYLLDGIDDFAIRNLVGSILSTAKKRKKGASVVFDSSSWANFGVKNNDRIFTRLTELGAAEQFEGESQAGFIQKITLAEHKIVVFMNGLNRLTAKAAFDLARDGKMVIMVTREGSVAAGLRALLNLIGQQHRHVSKLDGGDLALLRSLVSVTPIAKLEKPGAKSETHSINESMRLALEDYFGTGSFRGWQRIFKIAKAGGKREFDLDRLGGYLYKSDKRQGNKSVTNLVELVTIDEHLSRTLSGNVHITADTINYLLRAHLGNRFITKTEDGLIKALRGEVDIVEVIKNT